MSKIAECVDAVCKLVAEKIQVGFGISSPKLFCWKRSLRNLRRNSLH